ncbi:hypothetical protein [Campylobacter vulpis]|uniref:hypothetical protein n=1 Tax=Campylobacter vulpis TaxID=1655500 RepID=UPI001BCEB09E|nr:hypothetical protein [Campylobacter vulpis]MBS4235200.1 hypothetical protein [Campylobacter vulpis]MBS4268992.1 hypothetical protein [Campylobacter vulpis]
MRKYKTLDELFSNSKQGVFYLYSLKRFNKQDSKGYYTTIPLHAPGITQNGESGQEWKMA